MKFGDMELFLIEDGGFRLDGGGMFGVVPRAMWAKSDPPDEQNRIALNCNCLLVKTGDANVLIDTGCGGKWSDKEAAMFAIDKPRTLISDLERAGMKKEDITHVIHTHLHFDHAGGGTYIDNDGQLKTQFPNATYFAQRGEWEVANNPNSRDRRSYKPENLNPLTESGQLQFIDGDQEVLPGISVRVTGGHTKHHQVIFVKSGAHTAVYNGDLIPLVSHLPVPFVMAYDLYPLQTMTYKQSHLDEAAANDYLMIFEHSPFQNLKAGHLKINDRGRHDLVPVNLDDDEYSPSE
ncbi:putative quorum-quenching lactonase YtnP [bacterium BMS3Bbin04]|nr:putative quorum-quenching lactonase YtnP [bacterium BMS3Bbin04]